MSVNKAILVGAVQEIQELKQPSEDPVIAFSVITKETRVKDGKKTNRIEVHEVHACGKNAIRCNRFLTPGMIVYVEGKFWREGWTNEFGDPKEKTIIAADNIQFLARNLKVASE